MSSDRKKRFTKPRDKYTYVVICPWGEEGDFERKAEAEAWITQKIKDHPTHRPVDYRLFAELSFTVSVEGV